MTLYQRLYNVFWNYFDPIEPVEPTVRTAFDLLLMLRTKYTLPMRHGMKGSVPSNTEVRNWLKQGAVLINGFTPQPNDPVSFPITQLVFFPNGNRVTLV